VIGKVKSHLDIGCGLGYLLNEVNAKVKVGVEAYPEHERFKEIKVYRDLKNV